MSDRLADSLQVWGLEGDFVIFSDGSLGFGLEATPIDISCWENVRVNDLVSPILEFRGHGASNKNQRGESSHRA